LRETEIALEKAWNFFALLVVGEITMIFHYGFEKLAWVVLGGIAFWVLVLAIAFLSYKLRIEELEKVGKAKMERD